MEKSEESTDTERDQASQPRFGSPSKSLTIMMGAAVALGSIGGGFPKLGCSRRGPRGTEMEKVGKTDDGDDILQDRGGRKYTRNARGTIRRFNAEKPTEQPQREQDSSALTCSVPLVWNAGPARGGGGTAGKRDGVPWWWDGDLLVVVVECRGGPHVAMVSVYADEDKLDFVDPETGDFSFGYLPDDVSWWAKIEESLPQNDETCQPDEGGK